MTGRAVRESDIGPRDLGGRPGVRASEDASPGRPVRRRFLTAHSSQLLFTPELPRGNDV